MTDNNDSQDEQSPRPYPGLKSLNKWVGTWKVSGPDIKGQVRFEWMEGGNKGGRVIFEGTPKQLLTAKGSLTSAYLRS